MKSEQGNDQIPQIHAHINNSIKVSKDQTKDERNNRYYRIQYGKIIIKSLLFFLVGFLLSKVFIPF